MPLVQFRLGMTSRVFVGAVCCFVYGGCTSRDEVLSSPLVFLPQATSIGKYQASSLGECDAIRDAMSYGLYVTVINSSDRALWFSGSKQSGPNYFIREEVNGHHGTRWCSPGEGVVVVGAHLRPRGSGPPPKGHWALLMPDEGMTWMIPLKDATTELQMGMLVDRVGSNSRRSAAWIFSEPYKLVDRGGLLFAQKAVQTNIEDISSEETKAE